MSQSTSSDGHIYILTSPHCPYIKIGGTQHAPLKRIREVNASEPYKSLGPWTLHDFRQVTNWRRIEYQIHYTFRDRLISSIAGQKELFSVSAPDASQFLEQLDASVLIKKPVMDRMFQDKEFANYLALLFQTTAILNWLDFQGAWTFTLFPSTGNGRYYTLNIGRHEVAFATLPRGTEPSFHMIYMDELVKDFKEVSSWIKDRSGFFKHRSYASSLHHSTAVFFSGNFDDAKEFLSLTGVRRAILAYWNEALIQLQERNSSSLFARFHHWNAIAELNHRLRSSRAATTPNDVKALL